MCEMLIMIGYFMVQVNQFLSVVSFPHYCKHTFCSPRCSDGGVGMCNEKSTAVAYAR